MSIFFKVEQRTGYYCHCVSAKAVQLRQDKGQEPLLKNGECKTGRRTFRKVLCFMNADSNITMPSEFTARTSLYRARTRWTIDVMQVRGVTSFATT